MITKPACVTSKPAASFQGVTTPTVDPATYAAIAIVVAAGSEIIALLPIKSNSWVQLLLKLAKLAFPKK